MKQYAKRHDIESSKLKIVFFTDGSGRLSDWTNGTFGIDIFDFDTQKEFLSKISD
jgi:hypothetical protein